MLMNRSYLSRSLFMVFRAAGLCSQSRLYILSTKTLCRRTAPPSSIAKIFSGSQQITMSLAGIQDMTIPTEGFSQYRDIILRMARRSGRFKNPAWKGERLLTRLTRFLSIIDFSISSFTSFMVMLLPCTSSKTWDLSSMAMRRFGKVIAFDLKSASGGPSGAPVVGLMIVPPNGQSLIIRFSVSFLNFATRRILWSILVPQPWQIYDRSMSPYPLPRISKTLTHVSLLSRSLWLIVLLC